MRKTEVAALRLGLDLGMNLVDTAEMYGEGGAEEMISEAIKGRREEVFLVSKVYPHNATLRGAPEACARSLRRLKTDYLDLYLLHWPGGVPIAETLAAFQSLKRAGQILDYGVSNFDIDDMKDAHALPGGQEIVSNQVFYNLAHRGVEWDLLPWSVEHKQPIMAYSPIDQGSLLHHPVLNSVAARLDATPAQVALAWVLQQDIIAIPKAAHTQHVRENRAALDLALAKRDSQELERAFQPPRRKAPLEMR